MFVLFEVMGISLLNDPLAMLGKGGWLAAVTGVGLLVVDIFIPVPSSFVMVAHGALFGVWLGTLLSLAGSVGAALLGFAVGRAGLVSPEDKRRADRLLERRGTLAIVTTRPIALLAESVVILAAASPLGWRRSALAALAGATPPAVLYTLTGATAANFGSAALVFGLVLLRWSAGVAV